MFGSVVDGPLVSGSVMVDAPYAGPRVVAPPSLIASSRWQRKSEDWQAIASLATTLPLRRWAIHTATTTRRRHARPRVEPMMISDDYDFPPAPKREAFAMCLVAALVLAIVGWGL
jgi:hypothetical protein